MATNSEGSGAMDDQSAETRTPAVTVRRRESFLFDTRGSLLKYIIRMAALSLIPSMTLGIVLYWLGIMTAETGPSISISTPEDLAAIVVGAPVLETLLLAILLWLLSFGTKRMVPRAAIAAILWGVLHSMFAPAWGLVVWWPFFVFSCAYLAWRRRSWWRAFAAAAGVHFIQNFVPAIFVLISM